MGYAFIWNLDKHARRSQLELGLYLGPGFEFFNAETWVFGILSPLVRYKIPPMLAIQLEPLQMKGRVGLSDNTADSFDLHATVGAIIIFGSIEIGFDVLRYGYRLRRLDQQVIAGIRIGILRD